MKENFNQRLTEERALRRLIDVVEPIPQPDLAVVNKQLTLKEPDGMFVEMVMQRRLHSITTKVDREIAADAKSKRGWTSKLFDEKKENEHGK